MSEHWGDNVVKIEYSELVTIEEAWHKTTMSRVYDIYSEKSNQNAKKWRVKKGVYSIRV